MPEPRKLMLGEAVTGYFKLWSVWTYILVTMEDGRVLVDHAMEQFHPKAHIEWSDAAAEQARDKWTYPGLFNDKALRK